MPSLLGPFFLRYILMEWKLLCTICRLPLALLILIPMEHIFYGKLWMQYHGHNNNLNLKSQIFDVPHYTYIIEYFLLIKQVKNLNIPPIRAMCQVLAFLYYWHAHILYMGSQTEGCTSLFWGVSKSVATT